MSDSCDETNGKAIVVLVHGLAAHHILMAPLARSLRSQFDEVINWGYPSLFSPIERHGLALADRLQQLDRKEGHERIHLVTHSMGAIIARLALEKVVPKRFGRLVMISPPNKGSKLAGRFAPLLGRVFPPILQLTDECQSLVCTLPPPTVADIGIIAAKFDFLVHEASTHLACERDHIILRGFHSTLIWRRETAEQVRHFLEHGRFHRPSTKPLESDR